MKIKITEHQLDLIRENANESMIKFVENTLLDGTITKLDPAYIYIGVPYGEGKKTKDGTYSRLVISYYDFTKGTYNLHPSYIKTLHLDREYWGPKAAELGMDESEVKNLIIQYLKAKYKVPIKGVYWSLASMQNL